MFFANALYEGRGEDAKVRSGGQVEAASSPGMRGEDGAVRARGAIFKGMAEGRAGHFLALWTLRPSDHKEKTIN